MTERRYMTGYNGATKNLTELKAWSHWQGLDAEMQRRVLAMMDASIIAGRPIGIGSIYRSTQQQTDLFLSRHFAVSSGGCCGWNGKRYALRSGMAHAAPPGQSYHEPTTPLGKALALDMVGDLRYMDTICKAYGLQHFALINSEPWHIQGTDYPTGRSRYVASIHHPLKPYPLPAPPKPAATKIYAPTPTLRQEGPNNELQVRALQHACNFWGWRDAYGQVLIVDGVFAAKTNQAVRNMQKALGIVIDGVYGPVTAQAFQKFLDFMTGISS